MILTADKQTTSINRALELGAFKVLNKPLKVEEIDAILKEILQEKSA